jgi:hypothetical protein
MTAERNRQIKQVLTAAFGKGKVSVRGSRGTAAGWVTVDIAYAPRNREEREELTAKVWALFAAAKITIGTYGYDDPGSDYGHGSTMHLNFLQCLDVFNEGERVTWNGRTGTIKGRDYAAGGDWYDISMDDTGTVEQFYKRDLTRVMAEAA